MIAIDSGALLRMNRILGLAGKGAASTELDDGLLSQVIDVNPIVRRSLTTGISTGWFIGLLRNIHVAAGDESSEIDPYAPGGAASATSAYPAVVPEDTDVWVCGAWVSLGGGVGTLDAAELDLDTNANAQFQGWGIDDSGAAVTTGTGMELTQWEGLHLPASGVNAAGIEVGSGLTRSRIVQRIRRGLFLRFNSTAGTAAATFDCNVLLGLFPAGLGQDIAPG